MRVILLATFALLAGCRDDVCADKLLSLDLHWYGNNEVICQPGSSLRIESSDQVHVIVHCTCPVKDGGR